VSERAIAIQVAAEDEGLRADVVLGRKVPGLSRRVARRLALEGGLRIDGRRARPSDRVRGGQLLDLRVPASEVEPPPLRTVAITDAFVYVDKPAGMHTLALTPDQPACLSVQVARVFPECAAAGPDPREGGAVHRLDRDTSGLLAFARTAAAWHAARGAFAAGQVGKRYVAICEWSATSRFPPVGPPDALPGWIGPAVPPAARLPLPDLEPGPEVTVAIRAPLGRAERRDRVAVRLDGQPSITLVTARGHAPAGLVCEVDLVTGRRHQARVHLAWAGLPICGDVLYGRGGAGPLHLHAARLDLSAAVAGERPVTAIPPAAFFAEPDSDGG
jgi:23S rRNA pseudouridine1911/1915/1917 synthase